MEVDPLALEDLVERKLTQDVMDNQNEIPLIWPAEYNGDINPNKRMEKFNNLNDFESQWADHPLSALPGISPIWKDWLCTKH
eukprot:3720376-Karenia_brevis.AAC.1